MEGKAYALYCGDVRAGAFVVRQRPGIEPVYEVHLLEPVDRFVLPWGWWGKQNTAVPPTEQPLHSMLIRCWVKDRLPPPDRQNIASLVDKLGLERYDEFAFAVASGLCSHKDAWWVDFGEEVPL